MKKLLVIGFCLALACKSFADEGFWLALLLGDQVYGEMVKKGLRISREQLYSLNRSSLKDGIVLLNGEATGTVISGDGLLLTPYRQGLRMLAQAREEAKTRSGFFAGKRSEELPAKDFYADFLLRIDDVSTEVDNAIHGTFGLDREAKLAAIRSQLEKKSADERNGTFAVLRPVFSGNQWLLFVYQRYTDIRLVVAPPGALAEFGFTGEYWEWPSYRNDFSLFRLYGGPDGRPAPFGVANIPFRPRFSFTLSTKGYKEGDFCIGYGYPLKSNRYESSLGLKLRMEVVDPALVKILGIQRDFLLDEMKKDPSVSLQLGLREDRIARSAAFHEGEMKRLSRSNLPARQKAAEESFQQWMGGKQEYDNIFRDWARLYSLWTPYARHQVYLETGILGSPLMAFAAGMQRAEIALVKQNGGDIRRIMQDLTAARKLFLQSENKAADRKILAAMLKLFYTDIDRNQFPIGFYEGLKGSFGDLRDENSYSKYVNAVFAGTLIFDDARWNAFAANPDASVLQEDPAYKCANAFQQNWQSKFAVYYRQFQAGEEELQALYFRGQARMDPRKQRYPDADSTLRLVSGNIRSYSPGASVHYESMSTMAGLLEKASGWEGAAAVPPVFLEKARKKDFGPWLDKGKNDLMLGFIITSDYVEGMDGAPVLNANGELIGLVSSGNRESLARRYLYDPADSRSVCQDIRYILWTIETGGAGYLGSEIRQAK